MSSLMSLIAISSLLRFLPLSSVRAMARLSELGSECMALRTAVTTVSMVGGAVPDKSREMRMGGKAAPMDYGVLW